MIHRAFCQRLGSILELFVFKKKSLVNRMGASHSVEATDTTVAEIEAPVTEPELEEEVEYEPSPVQEMDWFWPFV
jgi:hypothetical protein